jgi:CO/xanthine dehydrogenase Mo-binding subunit
MSSQRCTDIEENVKLGDTTLPPSGGSGGSTTAASVCPGVYDAAMQAKLKLPQLAASDAQSPLHGATAAISNAIYNATGKRVRDLPITLNKIMQA